MVVIFTWLWKSHNHVFKACFLIELGEGRLRQTEFSIHLVEKLLLQFASRIFKSLAQRYLHDTSSSCDKSKKFPTTLQDLQCFTSPKIPLIWYKSQVPLPLTTDHLYPVGRLQEACKRKETQGIEVQSRSFGKLLRSWRDAVPEEGKG